MSHALLSRERIRVHPKGPDKRRHIVADTNVSPFVRALSICRRHKFCVRDTKNVSDFVQKHFVSPVCAAQETSWATMCPQQCVLVYQGLKSRAF